MAEDFAGKCGACRFWERWGTEAGGCKRYPPIMPKVTVNGRQRDYDRIERESLRGDSPPSREAREGVAATITGSTGGCSGKDAAE